VNDKNMVQIAPTPMQLMQAMIERGVDADQLDKMLTLQERWQANEARIAFSRALADFQASCPTIEKTRKADRYVYAPLDTVIKTIRPHLERCGLAVRFSTYMTGDTVITAVCTVTHRDGHSEVSEFAACIDDAMKVNDTQKVGSANSYAKRYALMNALNLVASDEDDDGYRASVETISKEVAATLRDELAVVDADEGKFCTWMKITSLEDMPVSRLPVAQKAIAAKKRVAK